MVEFQDLSMRILQHLRGAKWVGTGKGRPLSTGLTDRNVGATEPNRSIGVLDLARDMNEFDLRLHANIAWIFCGLLKFDLGAR
jgi:hypothetical protein